jgi:hypothetical protein
MISQEGNVTCSATLDRIGWSLPYRPRRLRSSRVQLTQDILEIIMK